MIFFLLLASEQISRTPPYTPPANFQTVAPPTAQMESLLVNGNFMLASMDAAT